MTKNVYFIFKCMSRIFLVSLLQTTLVIIPSAQDTHGDISKIKSIPPAELITESKQKNIGDAFRIIVKYYDNRSGSKQLVGRIKYGSEFPKTKEAYIWELKISKKMRSKGYGSYIVQQALQDLKKQGFSIVKVNAIPKNRSLYARLKAFYQNQGFETVVGNEMKADLTTLPNPNNEHRKPNGEILSKL